MQKIAVIVDACSTGKHLAPAFKKAGYECIHVKSSPQLPSKYRHNEKDFILSLICQHNEEELFRQLQPYAHNIQFCIPGYEPGVILADQLNEKLKLPGNDTKLSEARRNKLLMNQAVAQARLATVRQCCAENVEQIIEWRTKEIIDYPIVLKPLDSANGDGVYFCASEEEIKKAFARIKSSQNQFGQENTAVLAEELNRGEEYIINTVSWNGDHHIVEMWHVHRRLDTTIYDKVEATHFTEPEWEAIADYTKKTLDALGIHFGASTTEVKYTAKRGAVLLETSARLMSNAPLGFARDFFGTTQLDVLVEAYANPEMFLKKPEKVEEKSPPKYGMAVILISNTEGKMHTPLDVGKFKSLSTWHSQNIDAGKVGQRLVQTIDSLTAPGEIYLLSDEPDALNKDHQKIRSWERYLYSNAVAIKVEKGEASSAVTQLSFWQPSDLAKAQEAGAQKAEAAETETSARP